MRLPVSDTSAVGGIIIYEHYHFVHPTAQSAHEIGSYADGCIAIAADPDNAEQHAREATDALKRLDGHLRELGTGRKGVALCFVTFERPGVGRHRTGLRSRRSEGDSSAAARP